MKRKILFAIAAMIIATIGVLIYKHGNREHQFLDHAFVQLSGGRGSEPVTEIDLKSGDSAAVILEHDCCSGAGFDAVAVRTSDGQEFFSKKNYCGIEGFYGALEEDAVKDLPHFTAFIIAQGYQKKHER